MKRMTKGLLFLLTTVFTAALCALPAAASSVAEADLPALLSAADGFARAGEALYFTVAQCLYRWDGDSCATRVAQGVDGQLAGDADELYALNFNAVSYTHLWKNRAGIIDRPRSE